MWHQKLFTFVTLWLQSFNIRDAMFIADLNKEGVRAE